ncbi:hypothetical protein BH10BAC5_BH10BAC5_08990 [soil metagenome]
MEKIKYNQQSIDILTMIVSVFLFLEGIWGLFSPVVFGIFSTNVLHAVIHLALGAVGIFLSARAKSREFAVFLGALLLLVGIFYYLPDLGDLVVRLLNVNSSVAVFNIIVGIVLLSISLPSKLTKSNQR